MIATQYETLALCIDGKWLTSADRGGVDITNPATGMLLGVLPMATDAELDRALESAARGFKLWSRTAPAERCATILRAAKLVREREQAIATVMTLEQGKPIAESRAEVTRAAELMEWAAEEGRRTYGQTIPAPNGHRYLTFMEPIGAVAALTPWNFPAVSPARKVGSSLAAGCSCILKPSEQTPGTAVALVRAFVDAGLPPGVLNLVFGDPAKVSTRLIASPVVRKVTFTGSVPVGKQLAGLAAQSMKPCLMELGGHSPTIVFADADIQKIARASVVAKFRNAGQVCTSPTRFYVQEQAYEEFTRAFAEGCDALVLGDGMERTTQVGPLASQRRMASIETLVRDAKDHGAKVLAGGVRDSQGQGYFFRPTALGEVPLSARVMREEPFGPVAAFRPFKTVDEVLEQANSLPYGLAAYTFTNSIHTANAVSSGLACGIVGVNSFAGSNPETPFGGVKDSGYGREGGVEGVRAYMTCKFVVEGTL
jgi:succinate-semialdehyde dehydrogenase/glutarate-semialdehyde dehydrogenase